MKSTIFGAEKIENTGISLGYNDFYYKSRLVDPNGNQIPLMFTQHEINKAAKRAEGKIRLINKTGDDLAYYLLPETLNIDFNKQLRSLDSEPAVNTIFSLSEKKLSKEEISFFEEVNIIMRKRGLTTFIDLKNYNLHLKHSEILSFRRAYCELLVRIYGFSSVDTLMWK